MGHSNENLFLNYWNLNQAFYLKGVTSKLRFSKLLDIVQKRCPTIEVIQEPYGHGIKVLNNN